MKLVLREKGLAETRWEHDLGLGMRNPALTGVTTGPRCSSAGGQDRWDVLLDPKLDSKQTRSIYSGVDTFLKLEAKDDNEKPDRKSPGTLVQGH